jgi:SAM-dependent MidA family methyltransferase
MNPLQKQLQEMIERQGPISLAQFMACALYDPVAGYYASGRARIGKGGDFYTNVSIGPLFGKLLARQFAEMWILLGAPVEWTLVEQGAFDGKLAGDVLDALLEQSPDCYQATTLVLIEPFACFEIAQRALLARHSSKTRWAPSLQSCPPFTGVHYSNELLDAFPAHQVRWTEGRWVELRVGFSGDQFCWLEAEIADPAVARAVSRLSVPVEGAVREVCPLHEGWITDLSVKLKNGWILLCDYGLSEEELALPHRANGTLTAYRNHRRSACALQEPGGQDITYQLNFSNINRLGREKGLQLVASTEQSRFLTGVAPLHFKDSQTALSKEQQKEALAFRSLTHPELLGSRFKTLIFSKNRPASETLAGGRYASRRK